MADDDNGNASLSAEYKEFNFHPNEGNYQPTIRSVFTSLALRLAGR